MAVAKIILYKSKKKKDGTIPVVLRVAKGDRRKHIFLGFSCLESEWNNLETKFTRKYRDNETRRAHNHILKKYEVLAESILDEYRKNLKDFTLDDFEKEFKGTVKKITVWKFFVQKIDELEQLKKVGYADTFRYTRNSMQDFKNIKNLQFSDIDYQWLKKFEMHLFKKPVSGNTISVYMRTFRTLYNEAIRNGYAKAENYPFKSRYNPDGYDISAVEEKTGKRAIDKSDILKIKNLKTMNLAKEFARDLFMFSYYTMGMNFSDIAYLKKSQIRDGRIYYQRQKNRRSFSVSILPEVYEIMERHQTTTQYVFPIFNDQVHTTDRQKKDRIKTALKKFNKYMRMIAKEVGISTYMTSYVARHSWATVLKKVGVSTAVISEGLGHQDEKTTQIYLDSFGNEILDEANKKLL